MFKKDIIMSKGLFLDKIDEINANILETEKMLRESMNFYEEDSIEDTMEPEMEDDMEDDMDIPEETPVENNSSIESYIDHIRKYSLNGLSALCDNPESEEYQMLKKIFQMCDKKPEKKDNMVESHRLFGVWKENKHVLFETRVKDTKDFNKLRNTLISEATKKGYPASEIRLVSEKKLIR